MIDVLLATFRPDADLLKEQVDSIMAQKGVNVNLLQHEDGEGLGASGNFDCLLRKSRADYVSFSDQDDVWNSNKLLKCLVKLKELESFYGKDTPLLVFCDGRVTDVDLNPNLGTVISNQRVNVNGGLAFNRLLMQNFIAGNAMLFNAALREKAGRIPDGALMHDAWLSLVAAAFGHIGFVDEPLYSYRQHSDNALGSTTADACHFATRARQGVAAFRKRLLRNALQAQAFVNRFGSAAPVAARALAELPHANWWRRRALLVRHSLWKQGLLRNLALLVCS